jgi:cytochrome c peroxidase
VIATYDRIGLSIAAYEASSEVNGFSSRFDLYWRISLAAGNDPEATGLAEGAKEVLDPVGILTEQEFAGLKEFGEYCSRCHISHIPGPGGVPPLFTDFSFHNIGVPKNPELPFYKMDKVFLEDGTPINPLGPDFIDLGLGAFLAARPEWALLAPAHEGKFKVPTVRNVDQRPGNGFPKTYMHNGSLKSLEQVVHFYNTRDIASENWPPPEVPYNLNDELFEGHPIGNFQLTPEAEASIVAFLKTLTDGFVPQKK